MSNTPDALLVPLPTSLPSLSSTLIFTSGTGAGGVLRVSRRQPWMWIESSLRGGGFTQACVAADGTVAADAGALPAATSTEIARTNKAISCAAMVLGRACMGLLSPRLGLSVSGDYS